MDTSAATGHYASKDVGNNIVVTVTGITLNGAQANDYYVIPPTVTANITPAPLTISGITAQSKPYDSTTTAFLNTSAAVFSGLYPGDNVTLNGTTGTFASKSVANNIPVTATGLTLGGTQSNDYFLTASSLNFTANITPAPLTVIGVTVNDKVYDGTTAATLNVNNAVLVGVFKGDTVNLMINGATANFASPSPGKNVSVSVGGLGLSGAQSGDYLLTQPNLTGNITPRGTVSDSGSGLLTITLAANQTLGIVSSGSSYIFTSNQVLLPYSDLDPASQSSTFLGLGTTTLTLTSAGIIQYTAGIAIFDYGQGDSVTFNDSGANAYANNFNVSLSNPSAGAISFNGKSSFGNFNLQASTALNIQVNPAAVLSSTNGNITLNANQQANPTSGDFASITVNNATISSTGNGQITLQGTGGTTGSAEYGVYVENGGSISGGTKSVSVTGNGGNCPNNYPYGVFVTGTNSLISSKGGNVQVVGLGGGIYFTNPGGSFSDGVVISAGGEITAGGMGSVTVQGTGGQGADNNTGILVDGTASANGSGATITSSGGNVQITGTVSFSYSRADDNAVGIFIRLGLVTAGGLGSVTVSGTGGSTAGINDWGVYLGGSARPQSSEPA